MNPDYLNTTLCELAEKFPVGARVVIRAGTSLRYARARRDSYGTVISALERDTARARRGSDSNPSRNRVGSAFTSNRDGANHIAVRWDDSVLPDNIGSAFPGTLEILAPDAPKRFSQDDLDRAISTARTESYERGVREGKRLAARAVKDLGIRLGREGLGV